MRSASLPEEIPSFSDIDDAAAATEQSQHMARYSLQYRTANRYKNMLATTTRPPPPRSRSRWCCKTTSPIVLLDVLLMRWILSGLVLALFFILSHSLRDVCCALR
jgi:hypothetical protein